MRLASITLYRVKIPFKHHFTHASAARAEADNILIACRTTTGEVGWGETTARSYVTGETLEGTIERLLAVSDAAWWGSFDTASDITRFLLRSGVATANVASCAIEMALLDALAREQRLPLYALLAESWPELARVRSEGSLFYGGPFGLGSFLETCRTATKLRYYGFRDVKLKVSNDLRIDTRRLRVARWILGRQMDLRVDANEGWDLKHACAMGPALLHFGVSAVEQPFSKTGNSSIERFYERFRIPIIVDESLCSVEDARSFASSRATLLFAVKLAKLGGFHNTLQVLQIAEQNGIGVQIGCQVGESAILSAAGRHLAMLCPNLRYLEGSYDRFLLSDNVALEDISCGRQGLAPSLNGPGLGICVAEDAVERLLADKVVIASARHRVGESRRAS